MADYHTQFSCVFDVGSPGNVARALDLHRELGRVDEVVAAGLSR